MTTVQVTFNTAQSPKEIEKGKRNLRDSREGKDHDITTVTHPTRLR